MLELINRLYKDILKLLFDLNNCLIKGVLFLFKNKLLLLFCKEPLQQHKNKLGIKNINKAKKTDYYI